MISETIERIRAVLNSEDLAFGISTQDPARPFLMTGNGEVVRMTEDVARRILGAIERDWGQDAPEAIILRGLIDPRPAKRASDAATTVLQ